MVGDGFRHRETGNTKCQPPSGPSRARRARVILAVILCSGLPSALYAHPIHSTLSEITLDRAGTLTVRIRAFADDLSRAVNQFVRLPARPDFSMASADIARYLATSVSICERSGRSLPLTFIAQRRVGDVIFLELRGSIHDLAGALVRNGMLFDVHADQVNVVTAAYGTTRHTTLFSKGDRAKALP